MSPYGSHVPLSQALGHMVEVPTCRRCEQPAADDGTIPWPLTAPRYLLYLLFPFYDPGPPLRYCRDCLGQLQFLWLLAGLLGLAAAFVVLVLQLV